MAQVLTRNERQRTEKRITLLALVWVSGGFLLHTIFIVRYHWPWLIDLGTFTAWNFHIVIIGTVPGWALVLFNYGVYGLCVVVDGTAQIFYIVLILYLATGFRKTEHDLRLPGTDSVEVQISEIVVLAKAKKDIQLLKNLNSSFNDTFGLLITVNCTRDLLAMVATIAVLLQVKKVTKVLHEMETDLTCPSVHHECEKLAAETEGAGLITATGFSAINVEYVFGVFGMLITYAILIFQTSDDRVGSRDYARKDDIMKLSEGLQNVTRLADTLLTAIQGRFNHNI
ncbi:hypothetical protein RvY_00522 [Ramazzottius varieornatus]|uniref:Uncharacterized protein n=1 Tax=Ramazzottius varieornatus TaxID=947166 RepID=A0A1D1UJC2_RAMVA|nr:hypothetical protein RvY_00522 [Ramazzottius varieornatus]